MCKLTKSQTKPVFILLLSLSIVCKRSNVIDFLSLKCFYINMSTEEFPQEPVWLRADTQQVLNELMDVPLPDELPGAVRAGEGAEAVSGVQVEEDRLAVRASSSVVASERPARS